MQSDVESAATIRGALSDLYDGICGLNAERSRHQEPGSQAESEQADARWSQEIINACSIGTQLLESGGEHLTLFLKTITEPVEPIACWTCIRSMLEPCAFSAWLFEPQIDCAARAGRVFALRYEGMDQELKFGRIARQPQAVLDSISERIEATERKAIALGFRPLRNKKRERTGIGIVMPSATAVIGLMLELEPAYRLLSAVAHGHHWAITQLSFLRATQHPEFVTRTGVKIATFEKHMSIQAIGYLASIAVKAFGRAVKTHFHYVGANTAGVDTVVKGAFQRLGQAVPNPLTN